MNTQTHKGDYYENDRINLGVQDNILEKLGQVKHHGKNENLPLILNQQHKEASKRKMFS